MPFYALSGTDHCKRETYTAEEVLSILQQMIEAGSIQGIDPTKSPVVALIRESNADYNISLWVGSEAEFNALSPAPTAGLVMGRLDANGKLYFCTDDTTLSGWKTETIQEATEHAQQVCNATKAATDEDKEDQVSSATSGNFAGLDANGNLTDSGKNAASFEQPHKTAAVTLTADGWADNAQTVNVTGATESSTVIVSPAESGRAAFISGGVYCSGQAAGTLTFKCSTTPTEAIAVNVAILGGHA